MFDVKNNKAICILPWVHEFKDIGGNTGPCCYADSFKDNESIETVRKMMLDGDKPDICSKCYEREQKTNFSPRIIETNDWLKKFGTPDIEHPKLEYADIRYNPVCNLKCKMCGPASSTLWQKEKGITININKENQNYIHKLDKKVLKKVYLAGGEPTYIKDYLEFLNALHLVNPYCEVIINTNLKRLPDGWKQIIKKFENLTIICSCDAIGILGTYVRYPLWFSEFEQNVKWVSENANYLQFHLVASNLTAHKLHETCTWMTQYSKNIQLSALDSPQIFSEYAVPSEHREIYVNEIKKLLKFPVSITSAVGFRSEIQHLIKRYSTAQYDRSLHKKLQAELLQQDSHRSLKLNEVDPFLSHWIDS